MIRCKVMRTLTSVEIEIILLLGFPCCLSSSSVRCLENDPYEAIRQAYLVWTDTESEPFEDEAEAPESPHTVASPTSLPDSTPPTCHVEDSEGSDMSGVRSTSSNSIVPLSPDYPLTHTTPTLVPILRRTVHIVVCVPPTMSPGLSASMVEVAAMSDSTFRKRFRFSYESLPSASLPYLPLQKRYRGTSELVEDDKEEEDNEEGDDEEEDKEMEESLDSDSVSEGTEDEGPTAEDEDPAAGDEGLAVADEGPSIGVKSLSLRGDKVVPEGQQRAAPVAETAMGQSSRSVSEFERPEIVSARRQPTLTTWMDPEDGIVYIDGPAYPSPVPPAQTPPSPEWSSGLLPISLAPSIVTSPISLPMISLTIPSPVASPAMAEAKGFLTELGARVEMQGGLIRDHIVRLEELSLALFKRSLEHEQERVAVTFGAIWRPVLALESWAGQTDAQRAALWHAISDTHGENQELRLQLTEERRAWLELAKVVDSMKRGQEPIGDV
ncbi:hypothetical protein Tco_1473768 [Tanacetum coccineum]